MLALPKETPPKAALPGVWRSTETADTSTEERSTIGQYLIGLPEVFFAHFAESQRPLRSKSFGLGNRSAVRR
jgi:hypothetical protein